MITLAIPLKNCKQCSHYRGGYCYGFGTAKQVFSESEAILCGSYTPLGQVQIGPLHSLAGQLTEYQIPSGIISTVKLADLAVTVAKLGLSSVIDAKVATGAGIVESKLSLMFGTQALHDDIQTRVTSAQAVAAVEAVAELILSGKLTIKEATPNSISHLFIDSGTSGYDSIIDLRGFDNPTTEIFRAYLDDSALTAYLNVFPALTGGLKLRVNAINVLSIAPTGHVTLSNGLTVKGGQIDFNTVMGQLLSKESFIINIDSDNTQTDRVFRILKDTTGATGSILFELSELGDHYIDGNFEVKNGDLTLAATKTVDGVDVSEEPARITAEIDSDIATHAGLPSVHHTAYTDAMALAAVDEHLVIGSENATWIYCPLEGWSPQANSQLDSYGHVENTGTGLMNVFWGVPLPTNRGGKKLYVSGTRVGLNDADANDFVDNTYVYGLTNGADPTELDLDPTPKNSIGEHEDLSMGPLDCSPYDAIRIRLNCDCTTAGQLEIQYVTVRYYYA